MCISFRRRTTTTWLTRQILRMTLSTATRWMWKQTWRFCRIVYFSRPPTRSSASIFYEVSALNFYTESFAHPTRARESEKFPLIISSPSSVWGINILHRKFVKNSMNLILHPWRVIMNSRRNFSTFINFSVPIWARFNSPKKINTKFRGKKFHREEFFQVYKVGKLLFTFIFNPPPSIVRCSIRDKWKILHIAALLIRHFSFGVVFRLLLQTFRHVRSTPSEIKVSESLLMMLETSYRKEKLKAKSFPFEVFCVAGVSSRLERVDECYLASEHTATSSSGVLLSN